MGIGKVPSIGTRRQLKADSKKKKEKKMNMITADLRNYFHCVRPWRSKLRIEDEGEWRSLSGGGLHSLHLIILVVANAFLFSWSHGEWRHRRTMEKFSLN